MAKREKNTPNAHLDGRDGNGGTSLGDIGYDGKDTAEDKKGDFFKKRLPFEPF
jgi:hypothetical protein